MRKEKMDAYEDFCTDIVRFAMWNLLREDEKKIFHEHLKRLWNSDLIYGSYEQRHTSMRHLFDMFLFGAGYRPGKGWRKDIM